MTSDEPQEIVGHARPRAALLDWVLRIVGVLALAGGVALGLAGASALGDAGDDEDATVRIDAARATAADRESDREGRRQRRLDRVAESQRLGEELQDAVQALSRGHTSVLDDGAPGPVLDRAVDRWNQGDRGGAVAVLDAELGAPVGAIRETLRQIAFAQAVVSRATRQLPEAPR